MMRASIVLLTAMVLVACTEKPQAATARKADDKPWAAGQPDYMAQGFKAGGQAAWEAQIKARAQGQNDYARAPAQK